MATPAATRTESATTPRPPLWLTGALGVTTWKLGVTPGMAPRPRARTMRAGGVPGLGEELPQAQRRLG